MNINSTIAKTTPAGTAANTRPLLLLAGAVGVSAGLASLAYRSRSRSRWEEAGRSVNRLVHDAREEMQPWMVVTAGSAACAAALAAYLRSRGSRQTNWRRIAHRADSVARRAEKEFRPWAGLAASAAISLLSAAYSRRARSAPRQEAADRAADAGTRLLHSLRRIARESGRLYPRLRKLFA